MTFSKLPTMPTKRPTQADVARVAGVSRATVSYVVNGLANGQVSISQETFQRVQAAVLKLGYQPDARAQALRSGGKTNTLGLLLPDLNNPFYWKIAAAVEQEAQKAGFDLLLFSTSLSAEREAHTLNALARRQIDGLILSLTFPDALSQTLKQLGRRLNPVVILGKQLENLDTVAVNPGYQVYARHIMTYLFTMGHRTIGLIYGVVNPNIDSGRLAAYREALQEFGLEVDESLIDHCGTTLQDGYQAAYRLLAHQPRPTALVAINDLLALGALRAIAEHDLTVPRDISIVGFDDIDMAAYLNPPLTTVHYDAEAVGQAAVRLILARLNDPERPSEVIQLPTRLITRGSTAAAPAPLC